MRKYKITVSQFIEASIAWKCAVHGNTLWFTETERKEFCEAIGIKNWAINDKNSYIISEESYRKIKILNSGTPHWKALFKVIDVRLKKDVKIKLS